MVDQHTGSLYNNNKYKYSNITFFYNYWYHLLWLKYIKIIIIIIVDNESNVIFFYNMNF